MEKEGVRGASARVCKLDVLELIRRIAHALNVSSTLSPDVARY